MAFSYRYSATGLTIPGAVNAIAWGTAWTDDAGGHTVNSGNKPTKTDRRGWTGAGFVLANTGALNNAAACTSAGGNIRECGFAIVCQWGVHGRARRVLYGLDNFGGTGLFVAQNAIGCLQIDTANGANAVDFGSALPVPCNETIILAASGAGGTYANILGLTGQTGAVHALSGTPFGSAFYDTANSAARFGGAIGAVDVYSTAADITGSAAAKMAALATEFGIVTPTAGSGIILGDSIPTGAYTGIGNHTVACDIASGSTSLKQIFWKNNSENSKKLSDLVSLADGTRSSEYTAKVTDAVNWPISGKKVIVVALGTNDLGAGVTAANMLILAGFLAQRLREDHPTAAIVFNAVLVRGTLASMNTIRLAYNNGLAAAIAPYGGIYNDPASGVTEFNPANTDGAITTATAASAFQTYDNTPTLGAGDRLHPGPAGLDLLRTGFVRGAQTALDSLNNVKAMGNFMLMGGFRGGGGGRR